MFPAMTSGLKTSCAHLLLPLTLALVGALRGQSAAGLVLALTLESPARAERRPSLLAGRPPGQRLPDRGPELCQRFRAIFLPFALKTLLMLAEGGDPGEHLGPVVARQPRRGDLKRLRRLNGLRGPRPPAGAG